MGVCSRGLINNLLFLEGGLFEERADSRGANSRINGANVKDE